MRPVDLVLIVLFIRDQDRMLSSCTAQDLHDRREVQVCVRNVECKDAVGLEMAEAELQRLQSEQVHGNGVAGMLKRSALSVFSSSRLSHLMYQS
jgi:hypothetical protein